MSFYEFTGKSVKEAVAKACEELDVDEALLEIDVLEESTRGFLGIVGQRDARIRVRKRNIFQEVMQAEPAAAAEEDAMEIEPPPAREVAEEEYFESATEDLQATPDFVPVLTRPEPTEPTPEQSSYMQEASTVLQEILKRIPVDAQVDASIVEGAVYLDIKGDGSGLLIGKKGQTLDALQFLVNKIVNKENAPGEKIEIVVDTESYRLRKRESLRETALKSSQKAKKTLKPVALNPMPPYERRLIHLFLAEDREVYTKSYGEGALRRIVVYPRRGPVSKRRRR
ncbi:MAG: Jag N-terminal domain-containing protein [Desulfomonile tiedjei]|nr:Jag N-terminal domain-containing protein [Desulfomonile tiedjei]